MNKNPTQTKFRNSDEFYPQRILLLFEKWPKKSQLKVLKFLQNGQHCGKSAFIG